jgi:S1-C subfamily serine protease
MKKTRAKILILPGISLLLMLSCQTMKDSSYEPPKLSEITVEQLNKSIDNDNPFSAVQDISALRRENIGIEEAKLDSLYEKAIEKIEVLFFDAIEQKEFKRAFSIYKSSIVIGIEDRFEGWSEKDFLIALADKQVEQDKPIPGLAYFIRATDAGTLDEETLLRYGSIAIEENHRSSMKIILSQMTQRGLSIPGDFADFIKNRPTPSDMLEGTVTIWVDRGMKIEQGVGYPDRVIGSGFFIDKRGYLLTNYHVIQSEVDPEYEGYSRLYVRLSSSMEERIPAKVVGYDRIFDIALLKVEIEPPFVFSLGEKEKFSPGEKIYAIGSPGGLENTITSGIVSATGRRFLQMGDALQVDVPINPGNSGGPLLNEKGEMVGVVFAGLEQFEGVNFAIPAHWINDLLPDLYAGDEVSHPWLGMAVLEQKNELEVLYVLPGSPAYRAGIRYGDKITSINGKTFTKIGEIQQFLLTLLPETVISVTWEKNEEERTGILSLDERPYRPMDLALKRDVKENIFVPLFGFKVEETGSLFWENNYIVKEVYPGFVADETNISENDPLSVIRWFVEDEQRIAVLQIFIKKRKAGFLQKALQLAAYLEIDYFI